VVDAFSLEPEIGAQCRNDPVDAAIAAIAARQHGVIARIQLLRLGLGRRAIAHRIEQGRLHIVHRGVYAVGHARLTIQGRWMAAVLASGEGTGLSYRSAGMLWDIRRTERGLIEVTSPRTGRMLPGVQRHRAALPSDEVTVHQGIPVTTPTRTLLDLAAVLSLGALAKAFEQAQVLLHMPPATLAAEVLSRPRQRGNAKLRRILAGAVEPADVRSVLELRFLRMCAAYGIPRPRRQRPHRDVDARLLLARPRPRRGNRRLRVPPHRGGSPSRRDQGRVPP
jgi:hypothetical protein